MADQEFQKCSKQNMIIRPDARRQHLAIQPHTYCPKRGLETKSTSSFSSRETIDPKHGISNYLTVLGTRIWEIFQTNQTLGDV